MATGAPIIWRWTGEVMEPLARFARRCDIELVVGELYRMTVAEDRSAASHAHFFATVHEKWLSLPDQLATEFASDEILRRHALIMKGFRRERKFVASSQEEARKLAAFLRPQTIDDDYAIISVHGNVVVEWKAVSQSYKAMPEKGRFQASKQAVLDFIDDLLGVSAEDREGKAA